MKKILILVLIVGSLFGIQPDKFKHAGASGAIGFITYEILEAKTELSDIEKTLYSFATVLVVGAIKEATDDKFDNQDMIADGIGGGLGILSAKFIDIRW